MNEEKNGENLGNLENNEEEIEKAVSDDFDEPRADLEESIEELETVSDEIPDEPVEDVVNMVEDEEKNQKRDDLAAKFQSKMERKEEDIDEDEDVQEFITQKDVVYEEVEESHDFEPVKPSGRTSYFWTVALVVLIMTSLTIIVFLIITTRGSGDTVKQDQLFAFNSAKSSYDTIFVEATNKLIEAENDFNLEDFVEANDKAKEAEDDFDEALDYLYDLRTVKVDEEFSFLLEYYDTLEDISDLGEKMSNTLAFMARSADRSEYEDASDSKTKYQGYADDMEDLMGDLEKLKKQNKEFFGEN